MRLVDRTCPEHPFKCPRRSTASAWSSHGAHVLARVISQTQDYCSGCGAGHKVYPYLLGEVKMRRPDQMWAAYIAYVPVDRGFVYLAAAMDWHSRKVLSRRASNTMDVSFRVEALEEALGRYGRPGIFNTDQGNRFTSGAFTGVSKEKGIRISMDGKGIWRDNVFVERFWRSLKYEEVRLKAYESVGMAKAEMQTFFSLP